MTIGGDMNKFRVNSGYGNYLHTSFRTVLIKQSIALVYVPFGEHCSLVLIVSNLQLACLVQFQAAGVFRSDDRSLTP